MKFNINKEMVKTIGVAAGKIGKVIVIEGIKSVLLKGATNVVTTALSGGVEDVKKMTLDNYIGNKKSKINHMFVKKTKKVEAEITDDQLNEIIDATNVVLMKTNSDQK